MYPNTEDYASKTMKEHGERVKHIYEGIGKLKPGQQAMVVLPAFDFFTKPGSPDRQYGQHGASLLFAKANKRKVVTVEFYTGWYVNGGSIGGRSDMMCTGLYTHYKYKKDASEYAYANDDCTLNGGKCYGEAGSALYGDVLKEKLINFGSPAIWSEIDEELARDD